MNYMVIIKIIIKKLKLEIINLYNYMFYLK